MAEGQSKKLNQKVNNQAQASLKSHNLLTFERGICMINIPPTYEAGNVLNRHKCRHRGTCHLIPTAGMTSEDLIRQCHQLFVKEERERERALYTSSSLLLLVVQYEESGCSPFNLSDI